MLLQARLEKSEKKVANAIALVEQLKRPFDMAKAYYYYEWMLKDRMRKTEDNVYLQRTREIFETSGAKA